MILKLKPENFQYNNPQVKGKCKGEKKYLRVSSRRVGWRMKPHQQKETREIVLSRDETTGLEI